ncbi:MAG: phosphate acetyltransferase, partial [Salinibacterium sp.]|nr:phosphate acetyltransferase [Salinibacterium sp.]
LQQIAELTIPELQDAYANLLSVVANRADPEHLDEIVATLSASAHVPVWAIPEDPFLVAPTVEAIMSAVDGALLKGDSAILGREALGVVIAAMSMENVLPRLIEGSVVVIPGDRSEMLLAALTAHASDTFPTLAGIVLNGGFELSPVIDRLISGLDQTLPLITTELGTYATALRITQTRGRLTASSRRKIDTALGLFEKHVDAEVLKSALGAEQSTAVTPLMFEYALLERARSDRKHIVLPEGSDDRILLAAGTILARDAAQLTILGDEAEVRARASGLGADINAAAVVTTTDPELRERFAVEYTAMRAHKGMTIEDAREIMTDVSYFGTMMVQLGLADGMVSGAAHTTAHTITPAFQFVKTKPGVDVVSSVFFMALSDRVLVYGDCAVVPDPTAEQLADIAISSAATAQQFGVEPRIAMLSYSTGESGSGADVDKVRAATVLVRKRRPELLVDGPIQYDAAADPEVARTKMPNSAVAGRATVFIFPDLNTGNNTYKAVQRSSGAIAIGPVLQGLRKPVNDLSRGALVRDIVNTVAITAIQAQSS